MRTAVAKLNRVQLSPQKARRVADAIRGSSVQAASIQLSLLPQRPALPLKKLLTSAVNNAKQIGLEEDRLMIHSLTVDAGPIFKRSMPRAHGRATPIRKRTSHITLVLEEK